MMASLMSKNDKTLLIKKRPELVKNIQFENNGFMNLLVSKKVVNEAQEQDIKLSTSQDEKVVKLLELLPRRPSGTLDILCECLYDSGQKHVIQDCFPDFDMISFLSKRKEENTVPIAEDETIVNARGGNHGVATCTSVEVPPASFYGVARWTATEPPPTSFYIGTVDQENSSYTAMHSDVSENCIAQHPTDDDHPLQQHNSKKHVNPGYQLESHQSLPKTSAHPPDSPQVHAQASDTDESNYFEAALNSSHCGKIRHRTTSSNRQRDYPQHHGVPSQYGQKQSLQASTDNMMGQEMPTKHDAETELVVGMLRLLAKYHEEVNKTDNECAEIKEIKKNMKTLEDTLNKIESMQHIHIQQLLHENHELFDNLKEMLTLKTLTGMNKERMEKINRDCTDLSMAFSKLEVKLEKNEKRAEESTKDNQLLLGKTIGNEKKIKCLMFTVGVMAVVFGTCGLLLVFLQESCKN